MFLPGVKGDIVYGAFLRVNIFIFSFLGVTSTDKCVHVCHKVCECVCEFESG